MKKYRFPFIFLLTSFLLLLANIAIIIVFSIVEMENKFYNSLNVASLSISFVSFIVSSFFSFSVYAQAKNQNRINETLPRKDDQYIIANYSLFNIEKEVSFFSLSDEEKNVVLQNAAYMTGDDEPDTQHVTRLVFLPTDSANKPTYKVLIRSVSFCSAERQRIYTAKANGDLDGDYASNILQRGYNCICVDILDDPSTVQKYISQSKYIELSVDIISVFNVSMSVTFFIYLNSEKDVSRNPDKKQISDLRTYTIHHANYTIEKKSIVNRKI
jgi:hypothetical protein